MTNNAQVSDVLVSKSSTTVVLAFYTAFNSTGKLVRTAFGNDVTGSICCCDRVERGEGEGGGMRFNSLEG